jgi:hypothetical protein
MKTLLTLTKTNADGRVVETRKQYVRSFNKNFMSCSISHTPRYSRLLPALFYDISGGIRYIDVQTPASGYGFRRSSPIFLLLLLGVKHR